MKRTFPAVLLIGIICAWILVNFSDQRASAENCNVALDALNTCNQDAITVDCPDDCRGGNQEDGIDYSGDTVYTTTDGNSVSDGTENIDCTRRFECEENELEDKKCKEAPATIWGCDDEAGEECPEYEIKEGDWVPAPSAKIVACPE
jgi:hypothetical protein